MAMRKKEYLYIEVDGVRRVLWDYEEVVGTLPDLYPSLQREKKGKEKNKPFEKTKERKEKRNPLKTVQPIRPHCQSESVPTPMIATTPQGRPKGV